jgi:2-polyprenyl-3-methyl-5-hydroxy-6-metoxy-1,4-benzoquinol methylase
MITDSGHLASNPCRVCGHPVQEKFRKKNLLKYEAQYGLCPHCGFLQVDNPFWLAEAYDNAIAILDIGLPSRNLSMANRLGPKFKKFSNKNSRFLDYAGGYGLFTRMMRDKGFNFYWQDDYCENIFARSFSVLDHNNPRNFDLVTAFEVFEHMLYPLKEIEKIFTFSGNLLFSTELLPKTESVDQWWYLVPETGQHISFYSLHTLEYLASHFNKHLYSDNKSLHMLSETKMKVNFTSKPLSFKFLSWWERHRYKSLLGSDFTKIKSDLNKGM